MKQNRVIRNTAKSTAKRPPVVIDNRTYKQEESVQGSNDPVRTVLYVEVGDMEPLRVQLLITEVNKQYGSARGGTHYVIPVRNGKIGSDIMFEEEFMKVVNQLCEVKGGVIALKDGAREVAVTRQLI